MFKINTDLSIEITRGDAATFNVTAQNNGENYVFQAGDIVRFKVFEKKGCDCVVLQKDFPVETAIEEVTISLTEADTKIGDLINKPKDYWYEVELNPDTYPQTIIGYDENGAKIFKLYPEGKDLGNDPITPEDIPFVDKELDMTSHRPVENQAIATEFAAVKAAIEQNKETATEELNKKLPYSGGTMTGNLNMGGKKITNLATPTDNTDAVTKAYADTMLPKSGGVMSGAIAMDGSKITGLGTPTDDTDAVTKAYADTMLPKAGGTMSGAIAMGDNKITGLGTPTDAADAATKAYADTKAGKLKWLYTYGSLGLGHGEKSVTLETMHDYSWLMIVWKANKDSQQYYRSFIPVYKNDSMPSNQNLRIETIMGGGYYRNVSITDTGISVTTATKADGSGTATAYCTLCQVWGFQ